MRRVLHQQGFPQLRILRHAPHRLVGRAVSGFPRNHRARQPRLHLLGTAEQRPGQSVVLRPEADRRLDPVAPQARGDHGLRRQPGLPHHRGLPADRGGGMPHTGRRGGAGRGQRRDDLPPLVAQPLVAQPGRRAGRLRRGATDRPHAARPRRRPRGRGGHAHAHRHAPVHRHLRQQRPPHRLRAEIHPRAHRPETHGKRPGGTGAPLAQAARNALQARDGHVALRLHHPDAHRADDPAAVQRTERVGGRGRTGLRRHQEPLAHLQTH